MDRAFSSFRDVALTLSREAPRQMGESVMGASADRFYGISRNGDKQVFFAIHRETLSSDHSRCYSDIIRAIHRPKQRTTPTKRRYYSNPLLSLRFGRYSKIDTSQFTLALFLFNRLRITHYVVRKNNCPRSVAVPRSAFRVGNLGSDIISGNFHN